MMLESKTFTLHQLRLYMLAGILDNGTISSRKHLSSTPSLCLKFMGKAADRNFFFDAVGFCFFLYIQIKETYNNIISFQCKTNPFTFVSCVLFCKKHSTPSLYVVTYFRVAIRRRWDHPCIPPTPTSYHKSESQRATHSYWMRLCSGSKRIVLPALS
jgi:hypothetical protein